MKGRRKTYLIISIDIEQVFDKCSWRTRNTKPTANTIFNDKISKTSLRSGTKEGCHCCHFYNIVLEVLVRAIM